MAKSILSGLSSCGGSAVRIASTLLRSGEPIAEAFEYSVESICDDIPTVVDRSVQQARRYGSNAYRAVNEFGLEVEAKQKERFEHRYGSQDPTDAEMLAKMIEKRRNRRSKKENKQKKMTEMMALRHQVAELQKLVEQLKKSAS